MKKISMKKNLLDTHPFTDTRTEQFDIILASGEPAISGGFRLERILSFGRTTPVGEWYDQAWSEWVAVIRGMAILVYEGGASITLHSGDHLIIPSNRRHRVEYTSDDCVWLAFHYNQG
jgi:cupin 2 domain-containing protein